MPKSIKINREVPIDDEMIFIVQGIADGLTAKEISREYNNDLSDRQIENKIAQYKKSFSVKNVSELASFF